MNGPQLPTHQAAEGHHRALGHVGEPTPRAGDLADSNSWGRRRGHAVAHSHRLAASMLSPPLVLNAIATFGA